MEETRWERYKDPIRKAKRAYLDKKKTVTLVLDPEEHEAFKTYCELKGISMQKFFKSLAWEAVSKNSAK